MKRLIDITCPACHTDQIDVWVDSSNYPTCPCGAPMERLWTMHPSAVIGDDIPGGVLIEHGLCNADGTPRRFYSKSEIARAAKDKGLIPFVRHQGDKGSDRSPHTSRWV